MLAARSGREGADAGECTAVIAVVWEAVDRPMVRNGARGVLGCGCVGVTVCECVCMCVYSLTLKYIARIKYRHFFHREKSVRITLKA